MTTVHFSINGEAVELDLAPRELLVDVLRDRLGLTGTHGACEQGACGACTVLLDGVGVRSCLMLGVQAAGRRLVTIEAIGRPDQLHPLQQAFHDHHGLQCGFCTPGMILAAMELLQRNPKPDTEEIEREMSGSLCRCTGYAGIVDAVLAASHQGAFSESE